MRDLFATGRTPCRPEIDNHDLIAEILQSHCLPFQAGKRELRGSFSRAAWPGASGKSRDDKQSGKKCDWLPIVHHNLGLTIVVGTACDNSEQLYPAEEQLWHSPSKHN